MQTSLVSRSCALLSIVLVLQACGTSGPTRSDAGAREVPSVDAATADGVGMEPVPERAIQAYDRALAAMLNGDTTEAELELEQLILEYPEYPGPHVNLAIVYRQSGRATDAREALERALALDDNHAAAHNQLGILLRSEGDFAAAEAAYLRAIAADPDYALAHYNLGVLLDLYLRRPEEALEHYERFQGMLAEPNQQVALWIIDLRRRLGVPGDAARVAQEETS